MVVALDLEDRREAVADVDGARVLTRALNHAGTGRRQRLQVNARALVAAVLGPHPREDAELLERRLASEDRADLLPLLRGETVLGGGLDRDRGTRRHVRGGLRPSRFGTRSGTPS